MKKVLTVMMIAILCLSTFSIFAPKVKATGLPPVGYWKFDEGLGGVAQDSSGYGNDGIIHTATWTTGKVGSALHFNGVDSWVEVPNDPTLTAFSQITLEAWIQEDIVTAQLKGIISKCDGWAPPTNAEYFLGTNDNGRVFFETDHGVAIVGTQTDRLITQSGRWYHVAATWSGDSYAVYVDGQVVQAGTCTPQTTLSNTLPVQIGRHGTWSWVYFKGIIDEVKIYNYARTAEEIQNDYASAICYDVVIDPNGGELAVDGGLLFTDARTFHWQENSIHMLYAHDGYKPTDGTLLSFSEWSDGNCVGTREITVTGDMIYRAEWWYWYKLEISVFPEDGGGMVYRLDPYSQLPFGLEWVVSGTEVWVGVDVNKGYKFDEWILNGARAQDEDTWFARHTCIFVIDEPSEITAILTQKPNVHVKGKSPVNILATAPGGLKVGYDPDTNTTVNEIPDSEYSGPGTEPQDITIWDPINGTYVITLVGTANGNYTLTIEYITAVQTTTQTYTGTITPQERQSFAVLFSGTSSTSYRCAQVDIDPKSLNLVSKGSWITGYIELGKSFNMQNVDASSIKLNDTISVTLLAPVIVGDYDNDGIPDLMVKFDRKAVISYIYNQGIRYGNVALTITGQLNDGTPFEGTDVIKVIFPDLTNDRKVDARDLVIVIRAFGTTPSCPQGTGLFQWNPIADINQDGRVDARDLAIVASNYGTIVP